MGREQSLYLNCFNKTATRLNTNSDQMVTYIWGFWGLQRLLSFRKDMPRFAKMQVFFQILNMNSYISY